MTVENSSNEMANQLRRELEHYREMLRHSEKISAVGRFTAGVAHELNNPLTVIVGFSRILIEQPDAPDGPDLLRSIETEAIRCQQLIQQLLNFTRKQKSQKEKQNLSYVLQSALLLIQAQAKLRRIEVRTEFMPGLPPIVADINQIHQVLVSLCINAFDAMPTGGVLTLTALPRGKEVEIQVTDTGAGIPEDIRGRIFEPFFTTKETGRGTGLGLTLALEIVKNHDGNLLIHSEIGKGTTVSVFLPAETPAHPY